MANNVASLPEATNILDVKHATHAVDMVISDSGATAHFLLENSSVVNKRRAMQTLLTKLPDRTIIKYTHTCNLDIPWLPKQMTKAHIRTRASALIPNFHEKVL